MKQKQKYDFINKNVTFYKNKNVNICNTDGKLYNTNGKLNHLHIVYTTEKMKTFTILLLVRLSDLKITIFSKKNAIKLRLNFFDFNLNVLLSISNGIYFKIYSA